MTSSSTAANYDANSPVADLQTGNRVPLPAGFRSYESQVSSVSMRMTARQARVARDHSLDKKRTSIKNPRQHMWLETGQKCDRGRVADIDRDAGWVAETLFDRTGTHPVGHHHKSVQLVGYKLLRMLHNDVVWGPDIFLAQRWIQDWLFRKKDPRTGKYWSRVSRKVRSSMQP